MKVIVIGASGLIGNYLYNDFIGSEDCLGTYYSFKKEPFSELDIRNKEEVDKIIKNYRPNVILLSSAKTDVDYCEEFPRESREINIRGSQNVLESAKSIGAKLVYFSSDYIFPGDNGPYSEEDLPSPLNEYGRQKLEAENLIKSYLKDHLIIRTTVVYGWEEQEKNFIVRIIRRLKNKESFRVPSDQIGTPTYAGNLVRAVKELIIKNKIGIYHIAGSQVIDRYSFAKAACGVFGLNADLIIPVTSEELKQKARRPLKAGLKIDKIKKELVDTKLLGPYEGLKAMKDEQ